jgi:uncharacterized ion transporter superfamily protein YfcC
MSEEFLPLLPFFLVLGERLGYDRFVPLGVLVAAPAAGFAGALLNPFTLCVAQEMAGVPLRSGVWLRAILFALMLAATLIYTLRYAARVRRDPARSLAADLAPIPWGKVAAPPLSVVHVFLMLLGVLLFATAMWGVTTQGWWFRDMSAALLLFGAVAALVGHLTLYEASRAFVRGAEKMVLAALVVGFARAIVVLIGDGDVLDTALHGGVSALSGHSSHFAAQGMLLFHGGFNALVPSGSGQAALTMPLFAPLADATGVTRQTAVLAFHAGDGITNLLIPTSASLMAMLAMAGVPWQRWLRFALPLCGILFLLAAGCVAVAVAVGYQ